MSGYRNTCNLLSYQFSVPAENSTKYLDLDEISFQSNTFGDMFFLVVTCYVNISADGCKAMNTNHCLYLLPE